MARLTNILSILVGWLMEVPLPAPLNIFFGTLFTRVFGIDMQESKKPLAEFHSLDAIFTRELKEGIRPVQGEVCSPADGVLSRLEPLAEGDVIQAKGHQYPAWELAGDATTSWDGGAYFTVYLAPHNYHRVHCPIDGNLVSIQYVPGVLYPVNSLCVPSTPRLFIRNERLIFHVQTPRGRVAVVMVGALNVGKMTTPHWPDFVSNTIYSLFQAGKPEVREVPSVPVHCGDELGTFHLGSTVVVILEQKVCTSLSFASLSWGSPVKMGQMLAEKKS